MQCKPNSHTANSIRHAYSRYEYVRANTIGVVTASSYWLKFAAHWAPHWADSYEDMGMGLSEFLWMKNVWLYECIYCIAYSSWQCLFKKL